LVLDEPDELGEGDTCMKLRVAQRRYILRGKVVLVGGLGGGGDSGGAIPIAFELGRLGIGVVFAGFVNARVEDIRGAEWVAGALLRVHPGSSSGSVRFFEPSIARLGYETYCICCRESRSKVLEAVEWLVDNYGVETIISVDLGGDSLVFGDEPLVGSWKEDMAALSILAEVSKKNNVKTYLAVAVLGGEAGGKGLSLPHLAENIQRLVRDNAYHGYYEPMGTVREKTLRVLPVLLKRTPSAMLTLYLDSLSGKTGTRNYHILYLQGKYTVKPYYRYHFFFDPVKVCQRSMFCQHMMRQWRQRARTDIIRKTIRRTPRLSLDRVVERLLKKPFIIGEHV